MKAGSSSTLGQAALLAALYIVTGKLGLLFALPPGFATVIWPPSGIALGMLIAYGWRLWPGVLIGSLLLNLLNVATAGDAITPTVVLNSALVAMGGTLQAVTARALIARYIGLPLRLDHLRQILATIALAGPLSCLIAPSIGVGALWLTGTLPVSQVAGNWLVWWLGDVVGVIVFLPLVLIWPGAKDRVVWRGTAVRRLPTVALTVLMVPLGLTFYAWKISGEISHRDAEAEFASLASEYEKALLHRLDTYQNALLGGAGFFQGSLSVSREEWRRYVEVLQLHSNFPGINGIGWIEAVTPESLPDFLQRVRADDAPQFEIRPNADITPFYIITYIEPVEENRPAVGLNIAFEAHRLQAAELARDSGKAAITRRIVLVQDEQKTPGFLLLHPIYREGVSTATVAERRAALRGWIYAPFIANDLFYDLSAHGSHTHTLKIYDGDRERPEALIYSDASERSSAPVFAVRKQLQVLQQQWLVVWESAPVFEHREQTNTPLYILIGGLLFTTLFALMLVAVTLHQTQTIEWMAGEGKYALSTGVFLLLAVGSYTAFRSLQDAELAHVRERVQDEVGKVGLLLGSQVNDRLLALKRMGQRWHAAGGTPQSLWQADARNYLKQLGGLKSLEWVDTTHRIRWVEPWAERAVGRNVFDENGSGAPSKDGATVTPPLQLSQGYSAFLAYQPLSVGERFDGFLVGVFAIEDFFRSAISANTSDSYALAVDYDGKTYFSNGVPASLQQVEFGIEQRFLLNDQPWVLRLVPTHEFIASQRSPLPVAVLIAGMLIAVLSAISLRYILVSRLKSARLAESSSLNAAILQFAPIGQVLIAPGGRWLKVNPALCRLLDYSEEDLLAGHLQWLTDSEDNAQIVRKLQSGQVQTCQLEKIFQRRDGRVISMLLSISLVRRADQEVDYLVAQVQDITERKEMERLKNEFISVVSHELRTPLTSIRGSLGLLLGVFTKELPHKARSLLEIAYNNCERLIPLINDILDIDKIASGHMRFEMNEESVAALTRHAVQANEAYARKFHVRIAVAAIDESLCVLVDAARYQQVLSNLLSNAAKFSPAGGVIEVTAEARDGRVSIAVRDHGDGISEEFQPRIFSKFSQADSSTTRAKGGTGLGLHIARQLVEQMHGTIGFSTQVGVGTTFRVEFPLIAKTPQHEPSAVVHPTSEQRMT